MKHINITLTELEANAILTLVDVLCDGHHNPPEATRIYNKIIKGLRMVKG